MKKKIRPGSRLFCFAAALWMAFFAVSAPVSAAPLYLPDVNAQMSDASFWCAPLQEPDKLLADPYSIARLNTAILQEKSCQMTDLKTVSPSFDRERFLTGMSDSAASELTGFMKGGYYDMTGAPVTEALILPILQNIQGMQVSGYVRYGICTSRADMRLYPTIQVVTDEPGDNDYDCFQMTGLIVNEPVIVKAVSADGLYYYCISEVGGGWVFAGSIAICKSREEWLSAWDFPADRSLVVTTGKFTLERSNTNPDVSGLLVTMGTVLKKATDAEASLMITNRSSYSNYAVWVPIRKEDGSYEKKLALIPENRGVHEGYLPLTTRNILETAFNVLGDTYGIGSMLDSTDCSGYIRYVYRCFGLRLPMNTTRQAAMPVAKLSVEGAPDELKKQVLDAMPPGAALFFKGHAMLYLGHVGDKYYVVSSVSSIKDFAADGRLRVRGVVINTLDTKRMNGHTWLQDVHTVLLPYSGVQ